MVKLLIEEMIEEMIEEKNQRDRKNLRKTNNQNLEYNSYNKIKILAHDI